jgi:hypothetical protein
VNIRNVDRETLFAGTHFGLHFGRTWSLLLVRPEPDSWDYYCPTVVTAFHSAASVRMISLSSEIRFPPKVKISDSNSKWQNQNA